MQRNDMYSNEEIEFLKNNYKSMTHAQMAHILKRSGRAIQVKCFNLGLKQRKNHNDLKDTKINRLFLLERKSEKTNNKDRAYWLCKCECGNIKWIRQDAILDGSSTSCGECGLIFPTGDNHANYQGVGELSGYYFSKIKNRAENKKYEFNVTKEYLWNLFLKQNKLCSLTGQELCLAMSNRQIRKRKAIQTASLDRIDSNKGYTIGNVQWILVEVNKIKLDLEQSQFIKYCKLIYSYKPENQYIFDENVQIINAYMKDAQSRAKDSKREFDIDKNFILDLYNKQNRKCIFTGLYIAFSPKATIKKYYTASIDRIDSSIGYIKNNIQLVHKDINVMKRHLSDSYFRQLCSEVAIYCD